MKITEEVKQRGERKYPCLLQGHNGDVFYMSSRSTGIRLSVGTKNKLYAPGERLNEVLQRPCGLHYSNLGAAEMKYYTGALVLEND